ncbi:MAG: response regulator transcription factor [Bacillota bacterium]|nr:response regulator transcription factor [Bacillota bacterium]
MIFAVEDEASIRELYTYTLENDFDVQCFENAQGLYSALKSHNPDLVLLDIMLSGEDGFSILKKLKSDDRLCSIPVIMVSAKGEEISKVKGLNLGADDYIAKPFGVLELVARVKANLRKTKKEEKKDLVFKDIIIDDDKHSITVNNKTIQTTLKEYKLLKLLCQSAEKVVDRENLFSTVWGCDYIGETRTLDIHIKELRKKISEAESICEISTVRGVGYMIK